MLEEAVAAEDARHESGEGDAEGAQLEYGGEPPMAPQPPTRIVGNETLNDATPIPSTRMRDPTNPPDKILASVPGQFHPISAGKSRTKPIDKRRQEAAATARKKRKRVARALANLTAFDYAPSKATQGRLKDVGSSEVELAIDNLPAAGAGSYVGKRRTSHRKKPWTAHELRKLGFSVRKWDGV